MVMTTVGVGLGVYAAVAGTMYSIQERLVFPRHTVIYERLNRIFNENSGFEKYELDVAEGVSLKGVLSRSPNANAPLIVAYSGNGHDVIGFVRFLREVYGDSYHIVGTNYRGYGLPSYRSGGKPTQKDVLADALKLYDTAKNQLGAETAYVVGYSLGSSVGSYVLSQRNNAEGLVAITPFDGVGRIAQGRYPYLPVGLLLKHPFPSRYFIGAIDKPVSIIAAGADEVVPYKHLNGFREAVKNISYDATVEDAGHISLLDHAEFPDHLRLGLAAIKDQLLPENVVQLRKVD